MTLTMRRVWQLEAEAEFAATQEAFVRQAERRANLRRTWRWLKPWPLAAVTDPAVAVSVPGARTPPPTPGTDSGAAGSMVRVCRPSAAAAPGTDLSGSPHLSVVATSVSEAPRLAFGADVGAPGSRPTSPTCPARPGRPTLDCSEATRISGSHP